MSPRYSPRAERRLTGRRRAAARADRPGVPGERDQREPDDDGERRQHADAAGGARPPGHEHDHDSTLPICETSGSRPAALSTNSAGVQ